MKKNVAAKNGKSNGTPAPERFQERIRQADPTEIALARKQLARLRGEVRMLERFIDSRFATERIAKLHNHLESLVETTDRRDYVKYEVDSARAYTGVAAEIVQIEAAQFEPEERTDLDALMYERMCKELMVHPPREQAIAAIREAVRPRVGGRHKTNQKAGGKSAKAALNELFDIFGIEPFDCDKNARR